MIARLVSWCWRCWKLKRDPIGYARMIGVRIGSDCRLLVLEFATFGSEPYLVRLGGHVTVTSGVRFITHDGGVWVFRQGNPYIDVIAPITVGDNDFLGINSIILPGVRIGSNCVVGAGAVVTRDIPEGSVAAGVPARVLETVDAYWAKTQSKGLSVRSLPPKDKRRRLEGLWVNCGEKCHE